MELKINLATASLKDAEHAIFLIGAYFGMTDLPHVGASVHSQTTVSGSGAVVIPQPVPALHIPQTAHPESPALPQGDAYLAGIMERIDPAATFAANPAALPPGAGEAPMTADPAAVFAGNGATAPVGLPGTPGAAPSAPAVVVPGAGDAGNGVPTAPGPVGSSPAQPPAPAASAPVGVDVDKNGLPWDARIHASGEGGKKPKNADGSWRKKRGLNDAALVARVEAELRQTMAAGTPAAQPQAQVATPPAMPQPPSPPAAQPQPPVAVTGPQPAPTTFEQLMPRITAATIAGTLPQGALLQAVTAYALPNIPALSSRPDLVPSVWTYLASMYPAIA